MTAIDLKSLMKYLDAKFAAIDLRFEEVDQRFDKVYNILDSQAKHIDDNHQELMALVHQVDRHERWHHQTATKVGLKLKY